MFVNLCFRFQKGSTTYTMKHNNLYCLPRVTIELQCIDARLIKPIYPNRLVYTTCQLPNPPEVMFDSCHRHMAIKVLGLASNLIIDDKYCTLLLPSTLTLTSKEIIFPKYWPNTNVPHAEYDLKAGIFYSNFAP